MLNMEHAPAARQAREAGRHLDALIRIIAALRGGAIVEIGSIGSRGDSPAMGIYRLAIGDHPVCGLGTYIQAESRWGGFTATSHWLPLQWTLDALYQEAKNLTPEDLARLPRLTNQSRLDRLVMDLSGLRTGRAVSFGSDMRVILRAGCIMRVSKGGIVPLDESDDAGYLIARYASPVLGGAPRRKWN